MPTTPVSQWYHEPEIVGPPENVRSSLVPLGMGGEQTGVSGESGHVDDAAFNLGLVVVPVATMNGRSQNGVISS